MPFICLIDTSGIQDYIYQRNELRYIAAASRYLGALTEPGGLFQRVASRYPVAVIFAAGGNIALRAETEQPLKAICREISQMLLEEGSGLELVATIRPYEENKLAAGYLKALAVLDQRKLTQPKNVTFTFPGLESDAVRLSPPKDIRPSGYVLPTKTDTQLILHCSDEESDLMAVVSIDGIGMGNKLQTWMPSVLRDDIRFLTEFKLLSEYIQKRWDNAWESALVDLEKAFPSPDFLLEHPVLIDHELQPRKLRLWCNDDGNPYLPCRKIYQGGDDLTFICDARVVFGFTRNLVRHLEAPPEEQEAQGIPEIFHQLSFSVGLVILDAHFPFRRAVRMAEEIQKNAKKDSAEAVANSNQAPPTRIDWWLNRSGALDREMGVRSSLRPAAPEDWDSFEEDELMGAWKTFKESRNKLKALGEAIQDGPNAVEEFLALRGVPEPENPKATNRTLDFLPLLSRKTGFDSNQKTMLGEITELFDLHFPLPRRGSNGGGE